MGEIYKKGSGGELVVEHPAKDHYQVKYIRALIGHHERELARLKALLEEARKLGIAGAERE